MDLFLINGLNGIEDKGVECFKFDDVGQWQYVDQLAAEWLKNWNYDNVSFSGRTGTRSIKNDFNINTSDSGKYIEIRSAYIAGNSQNNIFSLQNVDDVCLIYVNDVLVLKSDYWSNLGGAEKGQKQTNTVFLKSGQNHVIMIYVNRGGAASCNFKINDANTNTFVWYQYSGGIASEQQRIAQQTASEQARVKAEQDAINKAQADKDKADRDAEALKIKLELAKLGGTGTGTNSNLLLFGGVGLAVLVGIIFMFKKKKRK
jgi:LPXTG-motif cell wall-anchored protein